MEIPLLFPSIYYRGGCFLERSTINCIYEKSIAYSPHGVAYPQSLC